MFNRIIMLTIVFLLIFLSYILYNALEIHEETIDNGWALKAKRNPYLATEMMLVRLGSPTDASDTKASLDDLDSYNSLLITNSGLVVNQPMANKIMQWVYRGGELVIGANENRGKLLEMLDIEYKAVSYDYEKDEPVLRGDGGNNSPLQKSLEGFDHEKNNKTCKQCDDSKGKENCKNCEEKDDSKNVEKNKKLSDLLKEANEKNHETSTSVDKTKSTPEVEKVPERRITHLQFNDEKPAINAAFSPWSVISHPAISRSDNENNDATKKKPSEENSVFEPVFWGNSSQGVHLIQFAEGKGKITVVSDASIWDSNQLPRLDHGVLLRSLGFHKKSLILYGISMPSLAALVWMHFPECIIALLFMLMLFLWRVAIRVGPIQFINSVDRRSIMDSILGLASYQHRRKKYHLLLEPLITDIQTSAKRRLPGFVSADSAKREKLLSDHTGINQKNINQLLNPCAVIDDQSFQITVTLLQNIKRTL